MSAERQITKLYSAEHVDSLLKCLGREDNRVYYYLMNTYWQNQFHEQIPCGSRLMTYEELSCNASLRDRSTHELLKKRFLQNLHRNGFVCAVFVPDTPLAKSEQDVIPGCFGKGYSNVKTSADKNQTEAAPAPVPTHERKQQKQVENACEVGLGGEALADFNGVQYGEEYITLSEGEASLKTTIVEQG